ncbi:LIM domain-containing protein PLIM2a-like [Ananas comosus]|uniref:LIM domain-containing protein PLIM2a-like n=1 Tax=Ananas comosus TaxID=4615 RepID=A0A6P5HI10_ANACO|nr:LIM domain-containing protein PLIM2a-like [Ananas comosus]
MPLGGTTEKCKACEKTVYPMDQLTPDGGTYHKSCFKCHHCKGTLQLGSYYSFEDSKPGPELTRPPSKAASMFSGTQDKCVTCSKTVYPLEKVY